MPHDKAVDHDKEDGLGHKHRKILVECEFILGSNGEISFPTVQPVCAEFFFCLSISECR